MRIWIAGGGTGGHVYPALAVVDALRSKQIDIELRWIGSRGGIEEDLVTREGILFEAIAAGGLHGVNWLSALRNAFKLLSGWIRSMGLVRRLRPHVLLVTGGFVSVPVAMACRLRRIPIVAYLPDVEPGLALRFVNRLATRIATSVEDSKQYTISDKVVVTGYPTRAFHNATRESAMEHFKLDAARKTVLVFGGSRGARSLNWALGSILDQVLAQWQVIHVSGTLDAAENKARHAELLPELQQHYHLFPYLHDDMGLAFAAADVVVSRAGASTLGEFPLFGLASILVPYPYAWRYQKVNADYLVSRGAAIRLNDESLNESLWPTLERLMSDDKLRSAMSKRARSMAQPRAAMHLADLLIGMARG